MSKYAPYLAYCHLITILGEESTCAQTAQPRSYHHHIRSMRLSAFCFLTGGGLHGHITHHGTLPAKSTTGCAVRRCIWLCRSHVDIAPNQCRRVQQCGCSEGRSCVKHNNKHECGRSDVHRARPVRYSELETHRAALELKKKKSGNLVDATLRRAGVNATRKAKKHRGIAWEGVAWRMVWAQTREGSLGWGTLVVCLVLRCFLSNMFTDDSVCLF